jgi:hypothetical protein
VVNQFTVAARVSAVICSPIWGVHDVAAEGFLLRRGHVICSGVSDATGANPLVAAAFRFRVSDGTLCGDMCTTQTPWSRRQSAGGLQITDMCVVLMRALWSGLGQSW